MESSNKYLGESMLRYPEMRISDAVKFLYQGEFGGGHLVHDKNNALSRLRAEYESTDLRTDIPAIEMLSEKAARINIGPVKGRISPETLCAVFVSSTERIAGETENFIYGLGALNDYFESDEVSAYLRSYTEKGCPAVSHSDLYREKYLPAYRVVSAEYLPLLPLLELIDSKKNAVVGIDGRCASGKTTLAAMLAEIYDCNVFHADDFFLPPEMRTEERLSEVGGNMHRERLRDEVLIPVKEKREAVYRKFNCSDFTFSDPIRVPYKRLTIVEGSYCLHPELADFYDIRVFSDIDEKTQLERIINREGEEGARSFMTRWIPMEERYFTGYGIRDRSDLIIRT